MKKKVHSPNPKNRKTWMCKCGLINIPEASECKGILMDKQKEEAKRSRMAGLVRKQNIKEQVQAVDDWLYSDEE